MARRGFTLIEVMAVVVLLALLAAAAAWSLASDVGRHLHADVIGQIAHADRMTRLTAQRTGEPSVLRIDFHEQQIWRIVGVDGPNPTESHRINVPEGYRIEEVAATRFPDAFGVRSRGYPTRIYGQVDIRYSREGRSVSYAVRLVSRKGEDGGNATDQPAQPKDTWLVFSGLSGQLSLEHDRRAIDNLFRLLATGRPDAD